MLLLSAAVLAWCVVLWAVVRSRLAARAIGTRQIEFAPTEDMSSEQLFECLLSGNFAVLAGDNFNQLASSLHEQRVKDLLAAHWGIRTRADCIQVIESRLERLGEVSPAEMRSIAAWLDEQRTGIGRAIHEEHDSCRLPGKRPAATGESRHGHLSVLAWDIQQLAYLLRLGRAVNHVSKSHAESLLKGLAASARTHFGCWRVYSLAALVGLGMRSSMEVFESPEWERFSSTHFALLRGRRSPLRYASSWSAAPGGPGSPARSMRPVFGIAF